MKKKTMGIMLALLLAGLAVTGCGGTPPEAEADFQAAAQETGAPTGQAQTPRAVDVDLTALSSTMAYGEVFQMMVTPEAYIGKRVKMAGQLSIYREEATGRVYFAVFIVDAAACCAQGIEFVRAGEYAYPQDYPPMGAEVTVVGEFQTYEEDGNLYIHLINADLAFEA